MLVYALLDNQSDACFVKQRLLDEVGVSGPQISLQTSTINEEETILYKKVSGLVVRGIYDERNIELPHAYSKENIPA